MGLGALPSMVASQALLSPPSLDGPEPGEEQVPAPGSHHLGTLSEYLGAPLSSRLRFQDLGSLLPC